MVDDYRRESLAIEVDTSLTGQRVSRILEALRQAGKLPHVMVCDNGTEFTSKAMLKWSVAKGIKLHFITPGKPTENAYIESFNGKLRLECLRQHWFASLAEARQIVEDWRQNYNHVRPHRSLGQRTPAEVLKLHETDPGRSLGVLWLAGVRSQQTFPGSQGLKVRIIGTGVVMHSVLTVDHDATAANHLVLVPAKDAYAIVPDAA